MRWIALLLLPFLMALEEPLPDQVSEARAQRLMQEIRCVACENEPISQSSAEIAGTMRVRVREMVSEGSTDAEVRAWFESRYGEFVLFRPSARGVSGIVLWILPFAIFLLGSVGIVVLRRGREQRSEIVPVGPDDYDHDNETIG